MTEVLPISCISCRKRKIKCNKLKPCNQCNRRNIDCSFPSTFRNIEIQGLESNEDFKEQPDVNENQLVEEINKLPTLKFDFLQKNNFQLICCLVDAFFDGYFLNFYKLFMNKQAILKFLADFNSVDKNNWDYENDLLVLIGILQLSISRLTPLAFIKLFDIDILQYSAYIKTLHRSLLNQFQKLRLKLFNKSLKTIQADILLIEHYFIEEAYEDCWLIMFRACSVAYSVEIYACTLDPHPVTGASESVSGKINSQNEHLSKLKIWYCLRIISDKISSILNRPNPITIRVHNFLQHYDRSNSIWLKIGFTECIRLLNMMLIENHVIDINVMEVMTVIKKYESEIELLEKYLQDIDNVNPGKPAILNDLIVISVNKVKLMVHFINKFKPEVCEIFVLNNIANSIIQYLQLIFKFLGVFETKMAGIDLSYMEIGKYFRTQLPFLNCLIHCGIVVILDFLNLQSNSFIHLTVKDKFNVPWFLVQLKAHLHRLISVDGQFNNKIWSIDILHAINKNLDHISLIDQRIQLLFVYDDL